MVGDLGCRNRGPPTARLIQLRRTTMGYVSQFLRVVCRVYRHWEVVPRPLMATGSDGRTRAEAQAKPCIQQTDIRTPCGS